MQILKDTNSKYTILYYENVDIDGLKARNDIANLIKQVGKKQIYSRAHEWCCGHGAIGLKLLETGICKHLVLTDKFEPAIQGCDFTITLNDLKNKVTTYNTDNLGSIPNTEQWDLFVANPPWRSEITPDMFPRSSDEERKKYDLGWNIHNHMWGNIAKYLTQDAETFLFEDKIGRAHV